MDLTLNMEFLIARKELESMTIIFQDLYVRVKIIRNIGTHGRHKLINFD